LIENLRHTTGILVRINANKDMFCHELLFPPFGLETISGNQINGYNKTIRFKQPFRVEIVNEQD